MKGYENNMKENERIMKKTWRKYEGKGRNMRGI